ncbi:MurR/RpiR family transcriptional regulator [Paramicrobacterium chengjingii]|uniref:MurR/RpiR family transcriptional regulator n=1 Tax=Paramicrobacterium chengjingii TaxID=2769067 RepID=A0ABX6YGQ3_9MICO|nr:MurR/RpiR family transcriptional regulator [Microbacterium chengjingii]QPZ37959.1 MurR/RpiR family transcriptional regulator [Microbacterium chengjingii]
MTPTKPGEVIATIRSLLPSLLPTERAVATVLLERSGEIVELSSQQVADAAGASRATVVRTCQSLGFTGYQQLRVLLARDAAYSQVPQPTGGHAPGTAGIIAETFRHVAAGIENMTALLDDAELDTAVEVLANASRVVVSGNGLSAPLALDVSARLSSIGRPAEAPLDVIGQQITARLLGENDVLLAVSGSGSNASTLRIATAARDAGARVIAVTAFARSPLTQLADINLVVTMPDLTFRDEITLASRLPQAILIEGLVAALTHRLGDVAVRAKALALDAISENLAE